MEAEEFKTQLKKLEDDHAKAKKDLQVKFGLESAKFERGDIIKNNTHTIRINRIQVLIHSSDLPEPVYSGPALKKDLTPMKNGNIETIYGHRQVELVQKLVIAAGPK